MATQFQGRNRVHIDPFGELLQGFRASQKDSYDRALKRVQMTNIMSRLKLAQTASARSGETHELQMQAQRLRMKYLPQELQDAVERRKLDRELYGARIDDLREGTTHRKTMNRWAEEGQADIYNANRDRFAFDRDLQEQYRKQWARPPASAARPQYENRLSPGLRPQSSSPGQPGAPESSGVPGIYVDPPTPPAKNGRRASVDPYLSPASYNPFDGMTDDSRMGGGMDGYVTPGRYANQTTGRHPQSGPGWDGHRDRPWYDVPPPPEDDDEESVNPNPFGDWEA